jgi:diguanylate cyclase (GGDEF)-like protein/PAS domain S-box-containing protein
MHDALRMGHDDVRAALPASMQTDAASFYRRLLDELYDGVSIVDENRRVLFWNRGAERLTGFQREEILGDRVSGPPPETAWPELPLGGGVGSLLDEVLQRGEPARRQLSLRHKDGHRIEVDIHMTPIRDDQERILGAVEVFRDASAIVTLEQAYARLENLAMHDPLTGVANRRQLENLLDANIELLRSSGVPFCLIMTDIDHFKRVNDTYGHAVGDRCLQRFANGLQSLSRSDDVVGRFGGEEFLIVLPRQRLDTAVRLAERLRQQITIRTAVRELAGRGLTASFGVAEARPRERRWGILERVDVALYRAKDNGRNRVEIAGGGRADGG